MNLALLTDWPRCLHFDTLDSYISAVYLALGLHAISQRMSDECKEKGTWPTEAVDRWHTSCLKAKEKKNAYNSFYSFFLSRNVVSLYPHSYLDSLYKRRLTAGHGVAPTQIDVKCWRTCWVVCVEGKDGIVVYFTHIFFFFCQIKDRNGESPMKRPLHRHAPLSPCCTCSLRWAVFKSLLRL